MWTLNFLNYSYTWNAPYVMKSATIHATWCAVTLFACLVSESGGHGPTVRHALSAGNPCTLGECAASSWSGRRTTGNCGKNCAQHSSESATLSNSHTSSLSHCFRMMAGRHPRGYCHVHIVSSLAISLEELCHGIIRNVANFENVGLCIPICCKVKRFREE
jgi:hypothetical protein